MKYFTRYRVRYDVGLFACLPLTQTVSAQTENDALMIPEAYVGAAGVYMEHSWDKYSEGSLKRTNLNMRTVSSNLYAVGGNYDLRNRINVLLFVTRPVTKFTNMANQAAMLMLSGAIQDRSVYDIGLLTGTKACQYAVERAKTAGNGN